ncbi:ATP-binding cassette domain-containing protein [Paenibacillus antri]|uniref:ATP-binding cassette domain-containing protein n=1 Tax=Paenibacillus antri TaxID=2582848 RepID=A0A5R9G760_9BACL|nr:ATP-binding cassette domain-containing protein [Paenibacillus antri]TLS48573.1 ATP-binding cassette domain-containing protein [Paenibacillus antri]
MIAYDNVTAAPRAAGARPVLDGVTLRIPEGQWVSVVGPNGSGKSTLLRLMNGLAAAQEGSIVVDGVELTQETVWTVRSKIGFVFQNPDSQSIGQTVAEDIVFGLENAGLDRETMRHRLYAHAERLGVSALLDRHPSRLSGGQKQRAALAAALATEPKIVLLDEATSMIDDAGKRDLLSLLRELRDSGQYTIVSVTHDTEELLASDRVVALNAGRIAADGSPRDVLARADVLDGCRQRAPFVRELAAALGERGIDVGDVWDDEGMVNALWSFASNA